MHIITNQQDQSLKKNYVVPKRNEKARNNCHIDQLIPLSKQILQKKYICRNNLRGFIKDYMKNMVKNSLKQ